MRSIRFSLRIISLCLTLAISLCGVTWPAFAAPAKLKNSTHVLVLQNTHNEVDVNLKNGVLQHNRAIAFLNKFEEFRPAFAISIVPQASNISPAPLLRQENNSFYKDYIRTLLPQKKPEDR